jgi:hypothetical protein
MLAKNKTPRKANLSGRFVNWSVAAFRDPEIGSPFATLFITTGALYPLLTKVQAGMPRPVHRRRSRLRAAAPPARGSGRPIGLSENDGARDGSYFAGRHPN